MMRCAYCDALLGLHRWYCGHCRAARERLIAQEGFRVRIQAYCSMACQTAHWTQVHPHQQDGWNHQMLCAATQHRHHCAGCRRPSLAKLATCSACRDFVRTMRGLFPGYIPEHVHQVGYCNQRCQAQHRRSHHKHHYVRGVRGALQRLGYEDATTNTTAPDGGDEPLVAVSVFTASDSGQDSAAPDLDQDGDV